MNKKLGLVGLVTFFCASGCGSNINEALLLAAESSTRTFLDIVLSDFYADLPDVFTLPPGPGEPVDDDTDGDGLGDANGSDPGTNGDGAVVFQANSCFTCHCDDASGGCLADAPNIQGVELVTIQEILQGERVHPGGKFPGLTDENLAGLEMFLAELAAAPPDDGAAALTGDQAAGETIFTANICGACHCDDASGGCLPSAPALQTTDNATLLDFLVGDPLHTGGKFPDLTDQDIADLAAFLAQVGG